MDVSRKREGEQMENQVKGEEGGGDECEERKKGVGLY